MTITIHMPERDRYKIICFILEQPSELGDHEILYF